jgi:hypothetical protein
MGVSDSVCKRQRYRGGAMFANENGADEYNLTFSADIKHSIGLWIQQQ